MSKEENKTITTIATIENKPTSTTIVQENKNNKDFVFEGFLHISTLQFLIFLSRNVIGSSLQGRDVMICEVVQQKHLNSFIKDLHKYFKEDILFFKLPSSIIMFNPYEMEPELGDSLKELIQEQNNLISQRLEELSKNTSDLVSYSGFSFSETSTEITPNKLLDKKFYQEMSYWFIEPEYELFAALPNFFYRYLSAYEKGLLGYPNNEYSYKELLKMTKEIFQNLYFNNDKPITINIEILKNILKNTNIEYRRIPLYEFILLLARDKYIEIKEESIASWITGQPFIPNKNKFINYLNITIKFLKTPDEISGIYTLEYQGLEMNTETGMVRYNNKLIPFVKQNSKEYKLLKYLLANPNERLKTLPLFNKISKRRENYVYKYEHKDKKYQEKQAIKQVVDRLKKRLGMTKGSLLTISLENDNMYVFLHKRTLSEEY
jgi:hypothetical protein